MQEDVNEMPMQVKSVWMVSEDYSVLSQLDEIAKETEKLWELIISLKEKLAPIHIDAPTLEMSENTDNEINITDLQMLTLKRKIALRNKVNLLSQFISNTRI